MPQLQSDVNRHNFTTANDVIVRYTVTAPAATPQQQPRLPLNIGLVIDRSGSMSGDKLNDAVDACRRIVQRISEIDYCTVVTFDHTAVTIADGARVTAARRALILHALDAVRSGGNTNLSGGWQMAAEQLIQQQQQVPGIISHIMLLTDGMANHGITDIESLEGMARDYQNRGISVSTYGLGTGYAERELRRIAEAGHGTHQFIEHSSDIERYFSNELSELFTVTFRDAQVRVTIPAGFSAEVIGQLPHKMVDNDIIVSIGSMVAHEQRNVYVRLTPQPNFAHGTSDVTATLSGVTNTDTPMQVHSRSQIQYGDPRSTDAVGINGELEYEAVLVDIAYVRAEAQRINRTQNFQAAAAYVKHMQARSDVFRRHTIYDQLAQEMHHVIDEWRAKRSESLNFVSKRSSVKDLMYLREQLAELLRRGITGTEVEMLRAKIEMLERYRGRGSDDQR